MLRLFKSTNSLKASVPLALQQVNARACSTHYGALNKFKLSKSDLKLSSPVQLFVEKYRKYGHHYSLIDPLELMEKKKFPTYSEFNLDQASSLKDGLDSGSYIHKLGLKDVKELEEFLAKTYTSAVGVEFDHVIDPEEREWLYNQYEELIHKDLNKDQQAKILKLLVKGEAVDHFLMKKFQTFKRYSGEGTESLLVILNTIFASASESGVTDVVLAMPHRGRFNVLVELLDYPAQDLFYKISGKTDTPSDLYTPIDDSPPHIATTLTKSFTKEIKEGSSQLKVSLLHNPSHLESVNPIAMGKTKARQDDFKNSEKTMNVQVHGDAAFTGQGVIYESFLLSKLPSFTVDGTVHVICNNQVGFTTVPRQGRSSQYPSDIVKQYGTPIIHVNADHPEEVLKVSELAVRYRQKFRKDFMIDLVGYRRYGHNEVDEPEFTNPLMYKQIRGSQLSVPQKYHQTLVAAGVSQKEEFNQIRDKFNEELEKSYRARDSVKKTVDLVTSEDYKGNRTLTGKWKGLVVSERGKDEKTGVDVDTLKKLAHASVATPSSFEMHPRIKKHHAQARVSQIEKNSIDWPAAEAVALGSLVGEGYNVRFSGQDVERGTFSHRHLIFTDVNNETKYSPFGQTSEAFTPKGRFHLNNSPLSEVGVLAYEMGYSMENPNNLVLWEAQFGDFFNPAQVVFDVFVTCSEAKWLRQSGLVVLLPHGMDGAGPEHSSCRIERFLQMGATDGGNRKLSLKQHDPQRKRLDIADQFFYENHQDVNFQFAQPSTPANYFHLLRRQMLRNYRKPLIVAAPKILLKHPQAKSTFEDMGPNTEFTPVFVQNVQEGDLSNVQTVIFCTGKISYDLRGLLAKAGENGKKVALFVIEELLPFPEQIVKEKLAGVNKSAQVVWMQEETMTSGAYSFVEPRLARVIRELEFKNQEVICHARRAIASTAIGSSELHAQETKALLNSLNNYI